MILFSQESPSAASIRFSSPRHLPFAAFSLENEPSVTLGTFHKKRRLTDITPTEVTTCGGVARRRTGILQTPGFPSPFPVPFRCNWIVDASAFPGASIVVYLTQVFITKSLRFESFAFLDTKGVLSIGRTDSKDSDSSFPSFDRRLVFDSDSRELKEVSWIRFNSPYLLATLALDRLEVQDIFWLMQSFYSPGSHIRDLGQLLRVYGLNMTFEVIAKSQFVRKRRCSLLECSMAGHCFAKKDFRSFFCSCFDGYFGSHCEYSRFCNPSKNATLCLNGGTCSENGEVSLEFIADKKKIKEFKDALSSSNSSLGDLTFLSEHPTYQFENQLLLKGKLQNTLNIKITMIIGESDLHNIKHMGSTAFHCFCKEGFSGALCQYKDIKSSSNLSNVSVLNCRRNDYTRICPFDGELATTTKSRYMWQKLLEMDSKGSYTALLRITRAAAEDDGELWCHVKDAGIHQWKATRVKVVKHNPVTVKPRTISLVKGENGSVTCISSNEQGMNPDTLEFFWMKNDTHIVRHDNYEIVENLYPSGSILHIYNASFRRLTLGYKATTILESLRQLLSSLTSSIPTSGEDVQIHDRFNQSEPPSLYPGQGESVVSFLVDVQEYLQLKVEIKRNVSEWRSISINMFKIVDNILTRESTVKNVQRILQLLSLPAKQLLLWNDKLTDHHNVSFHYPEIEVSHEREILKTKTDETYEDLVYQNKYLHDDASIVVYSEPVSWNHKNSTNFVSNLHYPRDEQSYPKWFSDKVSCQFSLTTKKKLEKFNKDIRQQGQSDSYEVDVETTNFDEQSFGHNGSLPPALPSIGINASSVWTLVAFQNRGSILSLNYTANTRYGYDLEHHLISNIIFVDVTRKDHLDNSHISKASGEKYLQQSINSSFDLTIEFFLNFHSLPDLTSLKKNQSGTWNVTCAEIPLNAKPYNSEVSTSSLVRNHWKLDFCKTIPSSAVKDRIIGKTSTIEENISQEVKDNFSVMCQCEKPGAYAVLVLLKKMKIKICEMFALAYDSNEIRMINISEFPDQCMCLTPVVETLIQVVKKNGS
ncbi:hypothetical protein J437_LFUL012611 [Ladona fulva]|uniref:Uncharacterized protein n=1 Tax=Ladona fulva TaxID=123851 RepID=A0A8K0KCN6_LADFU|nr:hypothetical protein J437_LFUL012611 [Ladona fulva]